MTYTRRTRITERQAARLAQNVGQPSPAPAPPKPKKSRAAPRLVRAGLQAMMQLEDGIEQYYVWIPRDGRMVMVAGPCASEKAARKAALEGIDEC